jgi:hypothetical protein
MAVFCDVYIQSSTICFPTTNIQIPLFFGEGSLFESNITELVECIESDYATEEKNNECHFTPYRLSSRCFIEVIKINNLHTLD